jgi:ABC-type multidrug transport system permease subunit
MRENTANPNPKPKFEPSSVPLREGAPRPHLASSSIHLTAPAHNGSVEHAIDISKTWAIVQKNWLVLKGDKVRLFPLILMPMLMIVIFGYASGNLPKHLPTAIVDYDQTGFSHEVAAQLSAIDFLAVKYQVGTQDEGKKLLDSGQIKVLFILPQGLSDKVAAGQPAQIDLMVDESDASVAQAAKGAASSYSQTLYASAVQRRLASISAQAKQADALLARSKQAGQSISSADIEPEAASSSALGRDAASLSSKSSTSLATAIRDLKNDLGYLIDQNEVLSGYGSGSLGQAALAQLATGDSQQAVLQQIAFYGGLQAAQARLATDAGQLAANSQLLAGQVRAQSAAAQTSISLQDAAGRQLELIQSTAPLASAPITIAILQPYGYDRRGIDFLLPSILALVIFQGAVMGLGRAIAGERKDGSLTRVFLTPTSNATIIVGTQIFYLLLETVRSSMIIFVAMVLFGVTISGALPDIIFIIALFAFGATGVGMVLSVMTKNQEQYMALGMLVSMPMMFLSGAFFPVQTMPPVLQSAAQVLPVTYAADALRGVMVKGFTLSQLVPDLLALAAFGALTTALSLMLFKRELV